MKGLATAGDLRGQRSWAVYVSLGLCLVFSLFYLASYANLEFFVLSNRGMVEHTVKGSLVSTNLDIAIWSFALLVCIAWFFSIFFSKISGKSCPFLKRFGISAILVGLVGWICLVFLEVLNVASLSVVSGLIIFLSLIFSLDVFSISRFKLLLRLLLGSISILLIIEIGALALFNAPMVFNLHIGAVGLQWNYIELCFSNLFYPTFGYVYLLFVLLGIVVFLSKALPFRRLFVKIRGEWLVTSWSRLNNVFDSNHTDVFDFLRSRYVLIAAVLVSLIVSCLFVIFTVLPWANPTNMLVSVDSPSYYQWIAYMHSVDVNGALSFALINDRALFLILAYALSFIASPLIVIQFVAALLIALFSIVSLLILRLFCGLRTVWVFAVLLVPFSFQALGLIYAGYFANMLGLILVFVYLVLFFKILESWSGLGFFALLGVSVLVLLSHSWTWFVFAVSLLLYLFLEWQLAVRDKGLWRRFKEKCILVGATVGVGLLVDLVRRLFSPLSSSASVLTTVHSGLSFPNVGFLLSGMQKTVDFDLGGVFANGLLVALSVVGFFVLIRFKSTVSNFFVSWVFVASASILFAAQDFVFDRFLFLMPWVVLSSLGLFSILRFASNRFDGRWRLFVCFVVLAFIFLLLLNNGLRYLFNINIL